MQITVKEATETMTSRGNPMLRVITTDGGKLGCFHASLFSMLQPGSTVEVETERRGNYSPNIVAVAPAEEPSPLPSAGEDKGEGVPRSQDAKDTLTSPTKVGAFSPADGGREKIGRDASIEAQTAAKCVTELICAGKLEVGGLAGQLAMAWHIGKLEAALPEPVVSAVTRRAKKPGK